ncbi:MAG: XdhC/CoxI family protein, partial [Deltaproteobacteria bacterium]|nr:XdhC/CoxI family protein [Deltaproteobacteria bacterium]
MVHAERVKELLSRGETLCLATVVQSDRADLPAGAKILVLRDGSVEGPAPSGAAGESLRELAREALARKQRRIAELAPGVRVFLDVVAPEVKLLICGAGHIALPLARFAREVGFTVTVL